MDMRIGEEAIRCLLYGRSASRAAEKEEQNGYIVMYVELRASQSEKPELAEKKKNRLIEFFNEELKQMDKPRYRLCYAGSHGYLSVVLVVSSPEPDNQARERLLIVLQQVMSRGIIHSLHAGVSGMSRNPSALKKLLHQVEYEVHNGNSICLTANPSTQQPASFHDTSSHNHQYVKVVLQIQQYIRDNLETIETVQQISKRFHFSPGYMNYIFKKHTGCTIFDFIIASRMEAAKQMLTEPRAKVYEVSLKLGYQNHSYFGSLFKQNTGFTPKQYIRKFGE